MASDHWEIPLLHFCTHAACCVIEGLQRPFRLGVKPRVSSMAPSIHVEKHSWPLTTILVKTILIIHLTTHQFVNVSTDWEVQAQSGTNGLCRTLCQALLLVSWLCNIQAAGTRIQQLPTCSPPRSSFISVWKQRKGNQIKDHHCCVFVLDFDL